MVSRPWDRGPRRRAQSSGGGLAAELTLYRAGQEGLTNIRKHARASNARLLLDFRAPDRVRLNVSDDGAGASLTA